MGTKENTAIFRKIKELKTDTMVYYLLMFATLMSLI